MKAKFFIDQQFGFPIWLEVENGKIIEFLGTGQMIEVLNERFVGMQIATFKEDFESQMKPAWYCVKSNNWCNLKQIVQAQESRITFFTNEFHHNKKLTSEQREGIKRQISECGKTLHEAELNLDLEIEVLASVHGFTVPTHTKLNLK